MHMVEGGGYPLYTCTPAVHEKNVPTSAFALSTQLGPSCTIKAHLTCNRPTHVGPGNTNVILYNYDSLYTIRIAISTTRNRYNYMHIFRDNYEYKARKQGIQ